MHLISRKFRILIDIKEVIRKFVRDTEKQFEVSG